MDAISNLPDTMKQPLSDALGMIRDAAGRFLDAARDQVEQTLSQQKERVADRLETICKSLEQSQRTLQDKGETTAADWLDSVGGACHSSASYLRRHDLSDLGGELSEFVRRRPQVVLGGLFVLGFLAARFVKSDRDQALQVEQPQSLSSVNEPFRTGAM